MNVIKLKTNKASSREKSNKVKFEEFRSKVRRVLLGFEMTDGVLFKTLVYALLICMGFVFLQPVLKMLSSSLKDFQDLIDPAIGYMPSKLYLENYQRAFNVLGLPKLFFEAFYVALVPTVLQTAAAALVGYGFARFRFPLKNLLFMLTLITFIIPPQVLMIPRYLMYKDLGILGSIAAFALPALFGQGLKSAIFILIFYQFFKMIPQSLEEAAKIDGASGFKIFFGIAIPMAVPAIIVSFIFSLVWYWNETYTTSLYSGGSLSTLPLALQRFEATYASTYPSSSETLERINEGIKMAGTMLTILPMLLVYFLLQRWFVEGVDRSGITGE